MAITGSSRRRAIGKVLGVVWAALCTASLAAEDVVTVRTPAGSVVSRNGTVVDYSASGLRLQPAIGREVAIPAEQIVRLETPQSAAHAEAERLFAARDYGSAADKFAAAVRGEDRAWMRREILARLVHCYRALGDGDSAGRVFLQLAKGDPTAKQFAAIPLAWRADDRLSVSQRQAREWLDSPGDGAANLIGASHLLTTTEAADANAALERLATDRDARVALLAEAQRWRVRRAGLVADEIARRRATVERLPAPLRAGPRFVLGETLAAAGRTDEAVAMLVCVAIERPEERPLAAASLVAAARALESSQRAEEAKLVWRELERDFGDLIRQGDRNGPRFGAPSNTEAEPDDGR